MDVQPGEQMRVLGAGAAPSFVGERQHERHRCVAERDGRCPRDSTGHVRDAVVHDSVDFVDRVFMRRCLGGFKATALVDCDVHQRGPRLHHGEIRFADQFRRSRARNEDGTDNHVSGRDHLGNVGPAGVTGPKAGAEYIVKIAHARKRSVEHGHVSAHSRGDPRGMRADNTAADDHDLCRTDTGDAAHQNATPAIGFLQCPCSDLRCKLPGNLGHGGEQGQAAIAVRYGFVGNGRAARGQQILCLLGIGRKVEIGEQQLTLAQHLALGRLRFLDLHNHVRRCEHLFRAVEDLCASVGVRGVVEAGTDPGTLLNKNGVPVRDGFLSRAGCHANTEFLRFDFSRASNLHGVSSEFV